MPWQDRASTALFHAVMGEPVPMSYVALLQENTGPDLFGPRFREASEGGYARVAVPATAWGRERNGMGVIVTLPGFTRGPFEGIAQDCTHFALFRSATGTDEADLLFWGGLSMPKLLSRNIFVPLELDIHITLD